LKKPLITIASGNPKKVAEIEAMLGHSQLKLKNNLALWMLKKPEKHI